MELEKDNYTKEEVQEIIVRLEEKINSLNAQLEEANNNQEKIKELEKSNLQNSIKLEMVKNGLNEDLYDLVDAPDLATAKGKINKLLALQKQENINNSYKPESKKNDDAYAKAEKAGDVKTMLSSKLSRFFD